MCDLLGKSEPVSPVDTEGTTPAQDSVRPSVRQMPQGKRHGRLDQLSHIAFAHIPALNVCIL